MCTSDSSLETTTSTEMSATDEAIEQGSALSESLSYIATAFGGAALIAQSWWLGMVGALTGISASLVYVFEDWTVSGAHPDYMQGLQEAMLYDQFNHYSGMHDWVYTHDFNLAYWDSYAD
jgi:hypothetical protein